ncbi:hypothetical protein R84B8_01371 [Treponema sp. R8-4-B8]
MDILLELKNTFNDVFHVDDNRNEEEKVQSIIENEIKPKQ